MYQITEFRTAAVRGTDISYSIPVSYPNTVFSNPAQRRGLYDVSTQTIKSVPFPPPTGPKTVTMSGLLTDTGYSDDFIGKDPHSLSGVAHDGTAAIFLADYLRGLVGTEIELKRKLYATGFEPDQIANAVLLRFDVTSTERPDMSGVQFDAEFILTSTNWSDDSTRTRVQNDAISEGNFTIPRYGRAPCYAPRVLVSPQPAGQDGFRMTGEGIDLIYRDVGGFTQSVVLDCENRTAATTSKHDRTFNVELQPAHQEITWCTLRKPINTFRFYRLSGTGEIDVTFYHEGRYE